MQGRDIRRDIRSGNCNCNHVFILNYMYKKCKNVTCTSVKLGRRIHLMHSCLCWTHMTAYPNPKIFQCVAKTWQCEIYRFLGPSQNLCRIPYSKERVSISSIYIKACLVRNCMGGPDILCDAEIIIHFHGLLMLFMNFTICRKICILLFLVPCTKSLKQTLISLMQLALRRGYPLSLL